MPKYLFILCSHSSGSTALWRLLQTSPVVSVLPEEGQFIKAVRPVMRQAPWDETRVLPWPTIKAEWDKAWDASKPILVEKSPPNLLHAVDIEQHFENAHFLVMVRNPYAYCEGTKRRNRSGLGYPENASYRDIAFGWVKEARYQFKNIKELKNVIHFTYEAFAEQPSRIVKKLLNFLPELETLDRNVSLYLHSLQGWVDRPLTNLTPVQIARLSSADIAEINSVLQNHLDILDFWGYPYLKAAYTPLSRWRLKLSSLYVEYVIRILQRTSRRLQRLRNSSGS